MRLDENLIHKLNGSEALHIATIYNSPEIAELAISHGADIEEKDDIE